MFITKNCFDEKNYMAENLSFFHTLTEKDFVKSTI